MDLDETLSEDIPFHPTNEQLKEKLVQYYQKLDIFERKNEKLIESLEYLKSKYDLMKVDKEQLQSLNDCLEEKYVEQCEISEKFQLENESLLKRIGKLENAVKLGTIRNSMLENVKSSQRQLCDKLIGVMDDKLKPIIGGRQQEKVIQNIEELELSKVIDNLESSLSKVIQIKKKETNDLKKEIKDLERKHEEEANLLEPLQKQLELEFERKEQLILREKDDVIRRCQDGERKFEQTWNELNETISNFEKAEKRYTENQERKDKKHELETNSLKSKILLLEKKIEYLKSTTPIGVTTLNQNNVTVEVERQMKKEIELEERVMELESTNTNIMEENQQLKDVLEEMKLKKNEMGKKNEEFSLIIGEYVDLEGDLEKMEQQFEKMKSIVDEVLPTKSLLLRRVIEKMKILMKEVRSKTGKGRKNSALSLSKFDVM